MLAKKVKLRKLASVGKRENLPSVEHGISWEEAGQNYSRQ